MAVMWTSLMALLWPELIPLWFSNADQREDDLFQHSAGRVQDTDCCREIRYIIDWWISKRNFSFSLQTTSVGSEVTSVLMMTRLQPKDANTLVSCIAHNNQLELPPTANVKGGFI